MNCIKLNVVKSTDGGVTWWCPYNVTDTHPNIDDPEFQIKSDNSF